MAATSFGHSGRTDSRGGHNSKYGGYHFHGTSSVRTPTVPFPAVRTTARTEPRRSPRRTAPDVSRYRSTKRMAEAEPLAAAGAAERDRNAKAAEERLAALARAEAAKEAGRLAAHYRFHHEELHPYDVFSFEDNERYWRVLLTKDFFVNLPKKDIARVEPVNCPTGFRTWADQTGRYSTVAKYVQYKKPYVQLVTPAERKVVVKEDELNELDQERLQEIIECRGPDAPKRRFFKSKQIDQVVAVTDVCLTLDTTHWKATAEVRRTTKGNRLLQDKEFKHPQYSVISDGSAPFSESRLNAERRLFEKHFPTETWNEIGEEEYTQLQQRFE